MHNLDWDDYHYFLHVAREGSLKRAAEKMQVNQSTMFRRINALEEKMQARLFTRHQTGYTLTEAGEEILAQVTRMEEEVLSVERKLLGKDIQLSGTIKISTTDTLGFYWLPQHIKAFKEAYPDIILDIDMTTRYSNLSKREADIVISTVMKQPETMVGRSLQPISFKLYGTHAYCTENGAPKTPEELPGHSLLLPNEVIGNIAVNRYLRKFVSEKEIAAMCDKLTGLYHLCLADIGLAPLPTYVGDKDDRLQPVMDLPRSTNNSIWVLTHPDLRHTARIKAFMDFMRQRVGD